MLPIELILISHGIVKILDNAAEITENVAKSTVETIESTAVIAAEITGNVTKSTAEIAMGVALTVAGAHIMNKLIIGTVSEFASACRVNSAVM